MIKFFRKKVTALQNKTAQYFKYTHWEFTPNAVVGFFHQKQP